MGLQFRFDLSNGESVEVYTTRPDTIFGASFVAVAADHPIAQGVAAAVRTAAAECLAAPGDPEPRLRELREAVATGESRSAAAEEEFGDLLFTLVNVARKLGIEPEAALRVANDKFQRRFDHLERSVKADGHTFKDRTLEQLEDYWQTAKRATKHTK